MNTRGEELAGGAVAAGRLALVEHVRGWAMRHGLDAGARPRQALAIATYVELCAPPGAAHNHLELLAELTALFFHLDDLGASGIHALAELQRLPGVAAFFAGFDERVHGSAGHRERLVASFEIWLAAIVEELQVDFATVSLARHWDLRRRNAFIDPYVDGWLAVLELEPPSALAAEVARARFAARDLIILANDLGSWERDRVRGGELADPNLIATRAREAASSDSDALAWIVAQHDRIAGACTDDLSLLAGHGGAARRVAGLLSSIVRGNVEAMRQLADRYEGARAVLDRLVLPPPV